MDCVTHHYSCDCREAKVKEMCEYIKWAHNSNTAWLAGFMEAIDAAARIGKDLYPEAASEDHDKS